MLGYLVHCVWLTPNRRDRTWNRGRSSAYTGSTKGQMSQDTGPVFLFTPSHIRAVSKKACHKTFRWQPPIPAQCPLQPRCRCPMKPSKQGGSEPSHRTSAYTLTVGLCNITSIRDILERPNKIHISHSFSVHKNTSTCTSTLNHIDHQPAARGFLVFVAMLDDHHAP